MIYRCLIGASGGWLVSQILPPPPMNLLLLLPAFAAIFAAGYLWPRGRKVANPNPHPNADEKYYLIHIQNEDHLFTEEQVRDARIRAVRAANS